MTWALLALNIVLSTTAGIVIQQQDDSRLPEINALISLAEPADDSQAFRYLLGIHSPAGSDPEAVGQALLEQIRQHEKAWASQPFAPDETGIYPALEQTLPEPSGPLFCQFSQPDCLASIIDASETLSQTVSEHQELLQRWHAFSQLSDYRVLTRPHLSEPLPLYLYLIKANRLSILNSFRIAQEGQPERARQQLADNTAFLRRFLAQEGHLIGKMVAVRLLSDQLDSLNALLIRYGMNASFSIPPLSMTEKSFEQTAARELSGFAQLHQHLDGRPDLLSPATDIPAWYAHLLFKPGLTTNAIWPVYNDFIASSEMSPADFTQHVTQTARPQPAPHWIRNPVGTILNQVALPNMRHYAGRLHDLDAKIRLFNTVHTHADQLRGQTLYRFSNPYYPSDPRDLKVETSAICLTGPLADTTGIRCLRGFQ